METKESHESLLKLLHQSSADGTSFMFFSQADCYHCKDITLHSLLSIATREPQLITLSSHALAVQPRLRWSELHANLRTVLPPAFVYQVRLPQF